MSRPRRFGVALVGVAALLATAVPALATPKAPGPPAEAAAKAVEDRVLVTWQPGTSEADRQRVRQAHGLTTQDVVDDVDLEALRVPARAPEHVAARLADEPAVAIAEPDYLLEPSVFDDPGLPELWGLHNTGQSDGLLDVDIDAPEAWQRTTGSDVVVAVIDTGMDIQHPDLVDNIWTNPGEIPDNGVDDDGNGYVDDVHGWDFIDDDATVRQSPDEDHHGTHVAGTIAASADNGIGVVGVAPDVAIMPLRFIGGDEGSGSTLEAVKAIDYAAANGASVINASWGGPDGGDTLKQAIARAEHVAFVAAVGNESLDIDSETRFPAGWADDRHGVGNVLSVTSVDRTGVLSSFSNFGDEAVDVGAPGTWIVSTLPGGRYGSSSGTSMATPFATGIAALAASLRSDLTGTELVDAVKDGAHPLSSLASITTTGGLVNAATTLALVAPPDEPDEDPVPDEEPAPEEEPEPDGASVDGACTDAPTTSFEDVPDGNVHGDAIDCVAAWSITTGTTPTTYAPREQVTRGQMATFFVRVLEAAGLVSDRSGDAFSDDDGSFHEPDIDALVNTGIVQGTDEGTYRPHRGITRAEMAAYLVRTHEHLTGQALAPARDHFSDDDESFHEDAINVAADLGLATGRGDGSFDPSGTVRRDEMASFLARLLDVLVEADALLVPTA